AATRRRTTPASSRHGAAVAAGTVPGSSADHDQAAAQPLERYPLGLRAFRIAPGPSQADRRTGGAVRARHLERVLQLRLRAARIDRREGHLTTARPGCRR